MMTNIPSVSRTTEIDALIAQDAVVAIGVSGGKDSHACAVAVARHLDQVGHRGPRVLCHSDLGRIEWRDSLPACERLAEALGWELMVVRRRAGDMLDRWETRWRNNVARYVELECMKVILPWSTPAMRFCTSELKVDVICSTLRKRWPGAAIVNASGIRRAESATRARMPVAAPMAKLTRRSAAGVAWNAIIEWSEADVWATIAASGVAPHEAYTVFGANRVSCVFCIMSTERDLRAAVGCEDNVDVYRHLVDLEVRSTFGFQGSRWLGDVSPELLDASSREQLAAAKRAALARQAAESRLPRDLLYVSGWPTRLPTWAEACVVAEVRSEVARLLSLPVAHCEPDAVLSRFDALLQAKKTRDSGAVLTA